MLKLLQNRTTPLKLADPGPREAEIAAALSAAQTAPDHARLQPWRFVVIQGAARAKFGAALCEALLERDSMATLEQQAKEREKPLRAPLLIVVAANTQPHPKVPECEQIAATDAAAMQMVLAFHAMGYGCQWKTGPASYDSQIKAVLGLHPADHIVGFFHIGTIAEPGQPKPAPHAGVVRVWN